MCYFPVEDIVRDIFADKLSEGKQIYAFKANVGPDGQRRFTDASACLAFEHAANEIGQGVVPFSLVLYIDGTFMKQHIPILPVYLSTRNVFKCIMNKPALQHLLALLPVYDFDASLLSKDEKTYRRKEVYFYLFLLISTYFNIFLLISTLFLH